jgi:hypothetical protein
MTDGTAKKYLEGIEAGQPGGPFLASTDLPEFVETTRGQRKRADLLETRGVHEDDKEKTFWLEYRDTDGELIHRSVNVNLKHNVMAGAFAAEF